MNNLFSNPHFSQVNAFNLFGNKDGKSLFGNNNSLFKGNNPSNPSSNFNLFSNTPNPGTETEEKNQSNKINLNPFTSEYQNTKKDGNNNNENTNNILNNTFKTNNLVKESTLFSNNKNTENNIFKFGDNKSIFFGQNQEGLFSINKKDKEYESNPFTEKNENKDKPEVDNNNAKLTNKTIFASNNSLFGNPTKSLFEHNIEPNNSLFVSNNNNDNNKNTGNFLFGSNEEDNKNNEVKNSIINIFNNNNDNDNDNNNEGGDNSENSENNNEINDKKIFINNNENITPKPNAYILSQSKNSFNPFQSKNNIEKTIINTNNKNELPKMEESLFKNNTNIIENNNNYNKKDDDEDDENNNEQNDINMEIDEDIKPDSDNDNLENINDIWISDNEDIIDDDIDNNKKIDYKKLEEKSKSKANNINDLNLLILPELSQYYFDKSKSISDYYTNSDSNIRDKYSIDISKKIIEILINKIESENLDEEKKSELINITTIYIYFDAFILHRDDIIYLMKLRDILLYKYYIPNEALINFDKRAKNNMPNNDIETIITLLKKIYFHLTLLDINKAYQQMGLLLQQYEKIFRSKILGDKTMKIKDLFMNLEKIIKIYNNIYSLKDNFNSKQIISSFNMIPVFNEVKDIIQDMLYDKDSMNESVKKIFFECEKISQLLTGNLDSIINDYNKENIHLLIMDNIFYRFYLNNFIKGIQDCLQRNKTALNLDKDILNKIILKIIQNCDQNQIEIVQELKGKYPFLLRYHMIEILFQNAFLYQVENQEKYLKKEAYNLFQNFIDLKIPFKYYLNYLSFYPNYEIFTVDDINEIDKLDDDSNEDKKEEGYRKALDYALIYISSLFNKMDNVDEIKIEIEDIKNEIGNKIIDNYSNDVLYKINKLCLIKFNEKKCYKYSILCYMDNYILENKDFNKLELRQQRKQLCADNDINYEYPKQFDKVIIDFYLKTNYIFNIESFKEIYETKKEQIEQDYKDIQEISKIILSKKETSQVDNSIIFMVNYIQFLIEVMRHNLNIIENNNKYDINIELSCKKFFENCFPLPKCPIFLWYHVLMIIKNIIDDNITLFSNDNFIGENNDLCEDLFIWDKKLIYEIIKIERHRGNNEINIDEANNMYENAISFINDITQGLYFNQNIYSIS